MNENNSKFSILEYAANFNRVHPIESTPSIEKSADSNRAAFQSWVEEIRSILVATKGKTEEEQQQYNDTLNRAVLGFEDDRTKILAIIEDLLSKKRVSNLHIHHDSFANLAEAIFAEVIGLNVLELILKNRTNLEEIQVVGKRIFEVRQGKTIRSAYQLQSIKDLERIQQNLVLFNSDTFNPRKKWAEVMLKDGSRVTMTGFGYTSEPTLTIRFFTLSHFDLPMLCKPNLATMNESIVEILMSILHSYFNIVIIGPTNSGKTNLLKALIAEMPNDERIITIESRYELMLQQDFPHKNVIEYEAVESDSMHNGKQAFKLALRQSPKRIVHAEIRDEDANIYVRACTRGHEGSVTSVHVNELEDVPDAITDMCMMDGRFMDPGRLRKRITEYVTQIGIEMAIVQGKRKIIRIGEYAFHHGEIAVREIVTYDFNKGDWIFPNVFSSKAVKRMMKYHRDGLESLQALGLVE